ncbi:MAG: hypothetical protein H0U49_00880 [Parachlamydiaceae bacterium]|nr:hypothetical protein [Parachlamydiaceae bacterium]
MHLAHNSHLSSYSSSSPAEKIFPLGNTIYTTKEIAVMIIASVAFAALGLTVGLSVAVILAMPIILTVGVIAACGTIAGMAVPITNIAIRSCRSGNFSNTNMKTVSDNRRTEQAKRSDSPKKTYSFDETTAKWLRSCGISSLTDATKVTLFEQNLQEAKYEERLASKYLNGNDSFANKKARFMKIMNLRNVTDSDFRKFSSWMALSKPPQELQNDPVLKNCVCPLTKKYPQNAVITDSATIYDKVAFESAFRQSGQVQKALPLKSVPELTSIAQYRLFEHSFLKNR